MGKIENQNTQRKPLQKCVFNIINKNKNNNHEKQKNKLKKKGKIFVIKLIVFVILVVCVCFFYIFFFVGGRGLILWIIFQKKTNKLVCPVFTVLYVFVVGFFKIKIRIVRTTWANGLVRCGYDIGERERILIRRADEYTSGDDDAVTWSYTWTILTVRRWDLWSSSMWTCSRPTSVPVRRTRTRGSALTRVRYPPYTRTSSPPHPQCSIQRETRRR